MPIDHTTGIKQSGTLTLNGSANQKSSGANNDFGGSNISSEFLGHTSGTESTSMSELYRATNSHTKTGGPVPNSDNNSGSSTTIPTSGQISMSQFYKSSNALDPADMIGETISGRTAAHGSGTSPNGTFGYGRAGSNTASSAYVSLVNSNECFSTYAFNSYSQFGVMQQGWDMILSTTRSTLKNGTPTGLTHSWLVRPYGASSTYTNSSGSTATKTTSQWTEIYKYTWIPAANGDFTNDSSPAFTSDFCFAPDHFAWNYAASSDASGQGGLANTVTIVNSGWSSSSGSSTNYYMPVLTNTSNTVYTVGDGDGLYSSNTVNDWTKTSTARGFRIYNYVFLECENFYQTRYITMNARWQDVKNSSDGSDNANSNTFGAGYHSHVSPSFTFKVTQQASHFGSC